MDIKIKRTYMDSLFRRLFDEDRGKKNLLSLYNAMNGTDYTDIDALECLTIEDVIFMGMKNDVAFLIDCQLNLYEHQGTYNPNMPLRGMLYCSQLYEKYLAIHDIKLYGTKLVKIPTPRYVVFYNGTYEQEDFVKLKLSDAFDVVDDSGEFQWTATMININFGHNKRLLESCKTLGEYTIFVDRIREYREKLGSLEKAVLVVVDECIEEGILVEFLKIHKAEVVTMILTEYDEQEARDWLRNEAREDGFEEGRQAGLEVGRQAGLEEGLESGKREAAIKFKAKGVSEDLIAETLDIPLEIIKKL